MEFLLAGTHATLTQFEWRHIQNQNKITKCDQNNGEYGAYPGCPGNLPLGKASIIRLFVSNRTAARPI